MKSFPFAILLFTVLSCYSNRVIINPEIREETYPKLNEINTQELGNSLVGQYYVEQSEFIVLSQKPEAKSIKINYEDLRFKLKSIEGQNKLYHNGIYGVMLLPNNELIAIQYALGNRFAKYQLKNQIDFEIIKADVPSEKNFIQEFIYNGRSGNTLKFYYREFNNDLIRPAFTQEAQYDISESDTIGFRKLRIQVLEATNTSIKYKVLSGF